jgi:UDP-N-acetylmuramoylalanine--D-glutamate ligase
MSLPASWHGNWSGLSAVVLGLGKSGFSVADTLIELGVKVTVIAKQAEPETLDLAELIGATVLHGDDPSQLQSLSATPDFDVVSPGFKPSHPLVLALQETGVELLTDIDLAWALKDKTPRIAKWLTITGTNGKTTTSELLAHMLRTGGFRAVACGNIGNPILDMIRDPDGFDYLIVELSSFQLLVFLFLSFNLSYNISHSY